MQKVDIHPKIVDSLGFSENEKKVFDVLVQYPIGRCVTRIAVDAGVPRVTTFAILKRFEERRLAERVLVGKRFRWKYKRGLEFLESKFSRQLIKAGTVS